MVDIIGKMGKVDKMIMEQVDEFMGDNWLEDTIPKDEYEDLHRDLHMNIEHVIKTFRIHKWREPYSKEELENYVLNDEYEIDKKYNLERIHLNRKEGILGVEINSKLRSEFDNDIFEIYGEDISRVGEFRGLRSLCVFKCNLCGNMFIETAQTLQEGKNVCCLKTNVSKGEKLVEKLLKENNIPFVKQCHDGCVNPSTNRKLPFDFVVQSPNKTFYLEIQGKQHYEPIEYFGGEEHHKQVLYRDKIKKNYANINGIFIELDYSKASLETLKRRFEEEFLSKYNEQIKGGQK